MHNRGSSCESFGISTVLSSTHTALVHRCSVHVAVITPPPVGRLSIAISVSVCLSASIVFATVCPICTKFFCLLPWLGPPLAALRNVVYFRFYGLRHILHIVGPLPRRAQANSPKRVHRAKGCRPPGAESAPLSTGFVDRQ